MRKFYRSSPQLFPLFSCFIRRMCFLHKHSCILGRVFFHPTEKLASFLVILKLDYSRVWRSSGAVTRQQALHRWARWPSTTPISTPIIMATILQFCIRERSHSSFKILLDYGITNRWIKRSYSLVFETCILLKAKLTFLQLIFQIQLNLSAQIFKYMKSDRKVGLESQINWNKKQMCKDI